MDGRHESENESRTRYDSMTLFNFVQLYMVYMHGAFPFDKLKDIKCVIKVITKLPNSEQSYKGKVQTHNYINRQNQSTTGKL